MITVKFKIEPSKEQKDILTEAAKEYIETVNALVEYIMSQYDPLRLSTADFSAGLPSAVKNETINAAKSVIKKYQEGKTESLPVLKKRVITWNNQNYKINGGSIEVPLLIGGKSKRVTIKAKLNDYQRERLENRLGSLRISVISGKWTAQVAVETEPKKTSGDGVMGVDLGLKVPAVAVTGKGKTRFFGNGRQNKQVRRKHKTRRRKLGKAKKPEAIRKTNDKEQRWMKDQDHKISKAVIDFAVANNVSVIRLEQLDNIRNTARTSRKNAKNLHTWSFYRLALYITYKAELRGIKVETVNPKYTSKKCPSCGTKNHADDRKYVCAICGFESHRDRVGAMNIINAPVVDGKSLPA